MSEELKTVKFQADLSVSDNETLCALMRDMGCRSKADFLSSAIYFFKMAANESQKGKRLASITPDGSVRMIIVPELERAALRASREGD